MTWMPPRTQKLNKRAEPCCTNRDCLPFPECCDCPNTPFNSTINMFVLNKNTITKWYNKNFVSNKQTISQLMKKKKQKTNNIRRFK